jgi:radical SAM superfamily enzyme YgiQ (UPF0313 family)
MGDVILVGLDQSCDKDGIVSRNETCEWLGIGYIRAYLNQIGIEAKVLNEEDNGIRIEKILERLPKVVGFSVLASNYDKSREFSRKLKEANKDIVVVWGGPMATNYSSQVLSEGSVDFIVNGEGEETFAKLFQAINGSQNARELKSISFFDGQTVVANPRGARLDSKVLDSVDFRIVHDYTKKFYAKQIPHTIPHSEMVFYIVSGSRGCWNDCDFCCSSSMWNRKIVYRSPANIADELEFLVKEKDANYIFFGDDDFLINSDWARAIAQEIVGREIKGSYHAMGSVRSASKFSAWNLLREAGFCEITIGMESTNMHILKSMGKRYQPTDLFDVANEITSHKIHLGLYSMIGYPGETAADIEHDIQTIQQLPFSRIRCVFATPYPGTRLYQQVEEGNLWMEGCRNNWGALTNDRPVIKTPAGQDYLIEARKRITNLYFSEGYQSRMMEMCDENPKNRRAFEEFQSFLREAV